MTSKYPYRFNMNNYIGYTVYLYMDNGRELSGGLLWISNTCMCVCVNDTVPTKHIVATDNVSLGVIYINGGRYYFT